MTWWRWAIAEAIRILLWSPKPQESRSDLRRKLVELERAEARCDRARQEQIWREIYGVEEVQ